MLNILLNKVLLLRQSAVKQEIVLSLLGFCLFTPKHSCTVFYIHIKTCITLYSEQIRQWVLLSFFKKVY